MKIKLSRQEWVDLQADAEDLRAVWEDIQNGWSWGPRTEEFVELLRAEEDGARRDDAPLLALGFKP